MDQTKCSICGDPKQHFAWVVSRVPEQKEGCESDPQESAVCLECFDSGNKYLAELKKFLGVLREACPPKPIGGRKDCLSANAGEEGRTIGVRIVHPNTVTEAEVKTEPRG